MFYIWLQMNLSDLRSRKDIILNSILDNKWICFLLHKVVISIFQGYLPRKQS